MFFSEKKLRELANINESINLNQIIEAINSIGFEVESVSNFNNVKGLKIGHVLSTKLNPNSNKLTICEIEFDDKIRTIQTAAKNVKKNDYVLAFIPGSKLNNLEITEKTMANVVSQGMLASFSELGFNSSLLTNKMNEEIIILPKTKLNLEPINYFLLNDNIIEVSILSNRSDAQCYEIFSKELAAYFKTKTKNQMITKNNNNFISDIELESNYECTLQGMEIIKKNFKLDIKDIILLLKSNYKIDDNEYINFSNLCLINTGVSLRCFDKDLINNKIKIKEKNGIYYLNDFKNDISILGVEEIEKFRANKNSEKVFFEFSQINEKIVRENSKISKITTNSSINNSRHISLGSLDLAEKFICKYFDKVSKTINKFENKIIKINFDKHYLNKYAGFDITKKIGYKNALKSLEILGFDFKKNVVYIPKTRHDIKSMQNIVEEIFRFYGLNNFELSQPHIKPFVPDKILSYEKIISSLGYIQAWTHTLMNKQKNDFNPFKFSKTFNLKTFISEEFNSIRNSIALPLYNVFDYNIKRKITKLSFFDIGMINNKKSIIIASNVKKFHEIKSDIEKIANQKFEIRKLDCEYLHPNYNAGLYLANHMVGWIGKFNPFKINSDVIFCEILFDSLYIPTNVFKDFDNKPLKERDLTIEIEKDYENVIYLNKINSIDGVFSIELISTFEKNKIKKLTYKILMNEEALIKFDEIDWENKEKIFQF